MKKILLILIVFSFLLSSLPVYASPIETALDNVANWLFNFLVFGAVIGIIIGAISILLSGGEPGRIATGRQIVIYSLIAVVVGLFSRILVVWIGNLAF